tara:strand:- start:366 stop:494 length:129 start_codon:yes stop_codon:yes gene_type:complete
MEFSTPTLTDDALLSITAVIICYIVIFTIAAIESRQRKNYKK